MKRDLIIAFKYLMLYLFTGLALAGCEKENTQILEIELKQSGFTYCTPNYISTFNPQLVDAGLAVDTLSVQLFDRLLSFDPATLQPAPSVAKSWEISTDGRVYVFNLQENIQFHHTDWFTPTRTLNAEDVAYSFNRILKKSHPYHFRSGGKYPWFEAMGLTELIIDVKAVNKHQVQFTLLHPDNTFLTNLATRYAIITSKEYGESLVRSKDFRNFDQKPIGTGPFKFDAYHQGSDIRLIRHNDYWKEKAKMQQVVINLSPFGVGEYTKVLSGDCDIIAEANASHLSLLQSNNNLTIKSQEGMNLAFLAINTTQPLLRDRRVRQAINLAIDKAHILSSVYFGAAAPANSVLSPFSWAYLPTPEREHNNDIEQAKKLLARVEEPLRPLSLWYSVIPKPYNPNPKKMAELIQTDLRKIGLQVTLHIGSTPTFNGDKKQQDLILTGWLPNSNNPNNFFKPLLTCQAIEHGLNYANWCHSIFDALIDQALITKSDAQRIELFNNAQIILRNELPIIPLAHGVQFEAYNNSINGVRMGPFGILDFTSIYRSDHK